MSLDHEDRTPAAHSSAPVARPRSALAEQPSQWRYRMYGLTLTTNQRVTGLPLAVAEVARPTVEIEFAGAAEYVAPHVAERMLAEIGTGVEDSGACGSRVSTWDDDEGNHVRFSYFGDGNRVDFVVNPQRDRLRVTWNDAALFSDVAALFAGPVLSALLRLRGETCLHASVLEVDGRAVAILGASGAGKSTTAAALAKLGWEIIADDIAVIAESSAAFGVCRAAAQLRLWPDAARAVQLPVDEAPRVLAATEKRLVDFAPCAARNGASPFGEPVPLLALYLLRDAAPGAATRFETVRAGTALLAITGQIYGPALLAAEQRAAEFTRLGRLAAAVPLRRLWRPRQLTELGDLARAIAADARQYVAV